MRLHIRKRKMLIDTRTHTTDWYWLHAFTIVLTLCVQVLSLFTRRTRCKMRREHASLSRRVLCCFQGVVLQSILGLSSMERRRVKRKALWPSPDRYSWYNTRRMALLIVFLLHLLFLSSKETHIFCVTYPKRRRHHIFICMPEKDWLYRTGLHALVVWAAVIKRCIQLLVKGNPLGPCNS